MQKRFGEFPLRLIFITFVKTQNHFMRKKFNLTGWCNPKRHFMADISGKVAQVMQIVEYGDYFIINRPRQYGKTTMLKTIDKVLSQSPEWLVFSISFEGISSEEYLKEGDFCNNFLQLLYNEMVEKEEVDLANFIIQDSNQFLSLSALSKFITQLVNKANKQLVLLIDEVDKSSNNQLFLDFLGILRNKYLSRELKTQKTFHSVILSGVHDIKTLKLKLRQGEENVLNSPWNIAVAFKVAMELQVEEIIPMLAEFGESRNVQIHTAQVADALFHYTTGYPFLVSALCKIIDEDILPQKGIKEITSKEVATAAKMLIQSSNVNFDSLKKNLLNNKALYSLVFDVLINNEAYPFTVHDPIIELGLVYGVFKKNKPNEGALKVHNRIYGEVISELMSSTMLRKIRAEKYNSPQSYLLANNRLNMEKVVSKFQEFQREEYTKRDRDFLERQGRLIFLAFLKPILNGGGFSFKEPQISEEKRLDIAITFYQHKYVIELKVWRGQKAQEKGLIQLADYLDKQDLDTGYLVIFDQRIKKSWHKEWFTVNNKRIFAVWV